MKQYTIFLNSGNIVNVKGDDHKWDDNTLRIFSNNEIVACFTSNSVEGYTKEYE